MTDKVFGEIEYDENWSGTVTLSFFHQEQTVDVYICGEEDDGIAEIQYDSFLVFKENWGKLQYEIAEKIMEYYCEERINLGFSQENNDDYPEISIVEELIKMIRLDAIVIPETDVYDGRCVALAFGCTWDEENGIGVRIENEIVSEVGYQDIAF